MAFSHTITVDDESGVLSGVFVQVSTDTGMVNVIRSDSTSEYGAGHVYPGSWHLLGLV